MNVAIDESLEMKNNKKINIYCTLYLKDTEFAINVTEIQEVVNYPELISPMPLAPDYLLGIFNLRNMVIPIIDLNLLLKFTSSRSLVSTKVAIVDFEGAKIGLIFDSTGEVLRVSDDVKNDFNYQSSDKMVVSGVLRINEQRLLQVIDTKALFKVENIPHIVDYQKKFGHALLAKTQKNNRKKCISFSVINLKLAFEISGIYEIVKIENVKESALASGLCLGYIHLRTFVVPLIDFSVLLELPRQVKMDVQDRRAIVLKINHEFFGLVVDSVDSINIYNDENVLPIPIITKNRVEMFKGCLNFEEGSDIFLLDENKVFTNEEVLAITQGHSKLYNDHENELTTSKKSRGLKQTFITFKLNNFFGIEIKEIREIINFSNEIFEAPGMPEFVFGMLNLRGKLVTIVDLRKLYQIRNEESHQSFSNCKILIFQVDNDLLGGIVDTVESIIHIDDSNRIKVPDIFLKSSNGTFQQDIKEFIEIPGSEDKKIGIIVIDKNKLISRIQNLMSDKSTPLSLKEISLDDNENSEEVS